MRLTLETALDLIPEHKANIISAFENLSRSLSSCSDNEYEVQKIRIQDLLTDLTNSEAYRYFHHVYNNIITVGSFYHQPVYRLPEPPHIELEKREELLQHEARC